MEELFYRTEGHRLTDEFNMYVYHNNIWYPNLLQGLPWYNVALFKKNSVHVMCNLLLPVVGGLFFK